MKKQITFTRTQLEAARKPMWHTAGNALLTMDDAAEWLAEVGIAPYVPVSDKLPAPTPTFVEAILGRPEKGYNPSAATTAAPTEDESYAVEVENSEEEEDIVGEEDDFQDQDDNFEDEDEEDFEDQDDEDEEEDLDDEEEDVEDSGESEEEDAIEASDEEEDEDTSDDEDEEAPEDDETPEASKDAIDDAIAGENPGPVAAEPVLINGFNPEEVENARRMLSRLIADGALVPLNLLGSTTGEVPDFVCSPQAFSFIYTLRGDKTWKQPPSTSGGQSVSPLALHVWESLKDKGEQTALELATEMGSGITGAAVIRALNELWQIGRVIPLVTADGSAAKWELTTTKFTRPIKAGSNAGLPTAISALMSLYLPQAIAASSDDIETILSPLAPRSRVREIVNNLHQTKQLESHVVDGKTLFFIPDTLPEFPKVKEPEPDTTEHVSRYERTPSKYPVRTPAGKRAQQDGEDRSSYGDRRRSNFSDRAASRSSEGDSSEQPRRDFTKPWDEERAARGPRREGDFPRREGGFERREGGFDRRPGGDRPSFSRRNDEGGERRPFNREGGGERRSFGGDRGGKSFGGPRKSFGGGDRERRPFNREASGGGDRPFRREGGFTPREGRSEGGFDRPRRPFTPREDGERRPFTPREGGDRPFRKSFGGDRGGSNFGGPRKSFGGGDRKPFSGGGDRDRRPFNREGSGGGDRPFRREGGFTPREGRSEGGFDRPRRPFTPREDGERRPFNREGGDRPFRKSFGGDREGGPRKSFGGGDRERRPFTPREGGERRPFTPREGGERRPFTPREGGERRPFTPREGGERRPFTPREGGDRKPFAPRGDRERRPFQSDPGNPRKSFGGPRTGGGFSGKPGGGFGRKPGGFGGPRKGPGSGPGRGGAPKRGGGGKRSE